MSIQRNRATALTVATAALCLLASCSAESQPVKSGAGAPTASATAKSDAAEVALDALVESESVGVELDEHGHAPHGPSDAEAGGVLPVESSAVAGVDPQPERGLDELDMGFDVGGLKIDLGGEGEPATGIPLAGSGLRKPTVVSTRGGMRMARGESPEHNFGDVREGESYSKDFKFVSNGESPLVVKTIAPSCGCTKSEIELIEEDGSRTPYTLGEAIGVGKKFMLLTEISTDGKHGHTEVTVKLTSNDPQGTTGVKLVADVEKVLVLEPANTMVLIDDMTVLEQKTHSVQLRSTRGERFKAGLGPEILLPDSIQADFSPVDPDEEGRASIWDVTLTLGPGLDEGRRNYPIYLSSDIQIPSPKYPSADGAPKYFTSVLSVQVNVIGLVSASPSFLGFGIVKPGQELVRTVDILCADETVLNQNPAYSILGLYDDNAQYADAYDITFEPLEGENGMRMFVRLKGMAEDVKGSFGGRIKVDIGHPGKESLIVKFSGICRAMLPGGQ